MTLRLPVHDFLLFSPPKTFTVIGFFPLNSSHSHVNKSGCSMCVCVCVFGLGYVGEGEYLQNLHIRFP